MSGCSVPEIPSESEGQLIIGRSAVEQIAARMAGFSLHAATACEGWQRSPLERLCRYITRPPIAAKRLSVDPQGRVIYRFKQPFRDGSTHVVVDPLDFMARLAALVPRPRLNLTRFHGVFAPNFKHRKRIVPRPPRHIDADQPPAPMTWAQPDREAPELALSLIQLREHTLQGRPAAEIDNFSGVFVEGRAVELRIVDIEADV